MPDSSDLVAAGVDMAVRFGQPRSSGMTSRKLLDTRVLTVASPAYLRQYGQPKAPRKLVEHDCIQFIDPQRGKPFEWLFMRGKETMTVETKGRLTLSDGDTLIGACLAGAGIAQVLALSVQPLMTSGALVDLFPDWPGETFPLYIVRPSRRLPPAAVEAFLDFCLDLCA